MLRIFNANPLILQVPAKKTGPFLIIADHENYGMGIVDGSNSWLLTAGVENTLQGVSMDITRFKASSSVSPGFAALEEMEGNFEGIMTYKNEMDEIEQHTVKGDFYYRQVF